MEEPNNVEPPHQDVENVHEASSSSRPTSSSGSGGSGHRSRSVEAQSLPLSALNLKLLSQTIKERSASVSSELVHLEIMKRMFPGRPRPPSPEAEEQAFVPGEWPADSPISSPNTDDVNYQNDSVAVRPVDYGMSFFNKKNLYDYGTIYVQ